VNMDNGSEAMPLNDVMVAQSALALDGFVDQVADADMEQRGAWHVQRVQAIYEALINSGQQMTAEQFNHHLAIMLAIAIDQRASQEGG